jgi:transcriptional regulator with XRE-family HTH domain
MSGHASLGTLSQPALCKINGSAAVLSVLGGEKYFHWMFHLLSRVELLREAGHELGQIDWVVANRICSPFQTQTLSELGVPRERIIETSESTHLLADWIFVPARPSRMSDMPRWVCKLRKQIGLSKSELARQCGVSPTCVWNWERPNGTQPRSVTLKKVAHCLGVTPDYLLSGNVSAAVPAKIDAADLKTVRRSVPKTPARRYGEDA